MTRFPDWPSRLATAITAASERPFCWGTHDCALAACDLVQAITGTDPAAELRGRYRTAAGAAKVLRRFAGGGLAEAAQTIAAALGSGAVPPLLAQRGDVVLVVTRQADSLGICLGEHVAVAATPAGLGFVPLAAGRLAWRV